MTPRTLLRPFALAAAIGLAAAAVVYGIALLTGERFVVAVPGAGEAPISPAMFLGTSLVVIVGAWVVASVALLLPRPRIVVLVVGALVFVFESALPFVATDRLSTQLWLTAIHLALAIPIFAAIVRSVPRVRTRARSTAPETDAASTDPATSARMTG